LACGTIGTGEKIFDVDPELSSGWTVTSPRQREMDADGRRVHF
jgi:hypothetical protein